MKYANKVQKGSIFERCDRNGKVWSAIVTKRTPLFVYVSVKNPYTDMIEDLCERVQIHQKQKAIQKKYVDFWGDERVITEDEPIDDYFIVIERYLDYHHHFMIFDLCK